MSCKARELRNQVKQDALTLLREVWRQIKQHKWALLVTCVVLGLAVAAIWPYDRSIHERITNNRVEHLVKIANKLRRWGDFRDTVTITLSVFIAGCWSRRRTWRRAALTAFTAACLAGLATNAIRFTAGRPRPPVNMPDRFYGPTLQYKMQSFPSGHSATSTASGVALFITLPGVGWLATLSAAGVVWACLYSRVHYLTDVLVGGMIGLIFGIMAGQVGRRMNRDVGEGDPLP